MNKKKLWIVSESEPIPDITKSGRLMRAGRLCEYALKNDFEVTWWSSTWMHYEKRFVSDVDLETKISNGTNIVLLHAKKAYKKHVSIDRIIYCKRMQKLFNKKINKVNELPDLIICSWPSIELSYESVKFGKKHNIPVIIDIRDLWPEIFVQPFSGLKRRIVFLIVKLLYGKIVRFVVKNAYQVIGVTQDAVDLAYRWGRKDNTLDKPIYLACNRKEYDEEILLINQSKWEKLGIFSSDKIFVYVGSIHLRNAKLNLIIEAATKLPNVKFVFCGSGPDLDLLVNNCKTLSNVFFPGYMNEAEINILEQEATCGILPYSNTPDFINALPTKMCEYLSNGLPVLTHLKGKSREILEENDCGGYFSNSEELVQLIQDYISNDEFLLTSKKNALKLFNECFNADFTYNDFMKSLKNKKEDGDNL